MCTLKELGLRVQLGHNHGSICTNPHPGHSNFLVLHTNGFHHLSVDFCNCDNIQSAGTFRQQLLHQEWFPATPTEPQTCCTFRLLEFFHLQTLQGKVTMYDFYMALKRLTDNTGLKAPKDHYKTFMCIVHEWRFLKMLERAGRGHDECGVQGTWPGSWQSFALLAPIQA